MYAHVHINIHIYYVGPGLLLRQLYFPVDFCRFWAKVEVLRCGAVEEASRYWRSLMILRKHQDTAEASRYCTAVSFKEPSFLLKRTQDTAEAIRPVVDRLYASTPRSRLRASGASGRSLAAGACDDVGLKSPAEGPPPPRDQ